MNAFLRAAVLVLLIWEVTGHETKTRPCHCQLRKVANISLQELEGPWFVVAMVNETNLSEHRSCIKMVYEYDWENRFVNVTRTSILYNGTEIVANSAAFGMVTPGKVDMSYLIDNGTVEDNYHDSYLEHTPGESFIFVTCERLNQKLFTDRVALFMTERIVDYETIKAKYKSVGIDLDDPKNTYYPVPQENCTN